MKKIALIVFVMLAMMSTAYAGGEVNFLLGQKMLDEDDWEPFEDQPEFGVLMSFAGKDWPIHIAVDLLGSADDVTVGGVGKVEGSTSELDVGIRKIWKKGKARPFFGGGIALINGEFEALGVSFDDDGVGGWIDGGVFWKLTPRFNLGVEARVSRAEISIFGIDAEAGGQHIGLILGFGWPKNSTYQYPSR